MDADAHEDENEPQAGPSRSSGQAVQQSASATSDSDSSSSHSSQDFCDLPSDETAPSTPRKKQKESLRGLAFPSTPLRGRNKSRAARDDAEADELVAQPAAATRRHNSLSPLRIFPSLHSALHDRAATAHPTTEHASTSPYQHPRGMSSFFRSTTSLALLHGNGNGNGNTTPTTLKSKSSMTNLSSNGTSPKRKLFPSKGKERAERTDRSDKVEIDPELDQLDTWEVIDATEAQGADASAELKTNKDKKEERRRSPDQMAEVPTVEPFKGQTEATPTAPVSTPVEPQGQRPHPPPVQTQQLSVHPLSLRDRKVPIPSVERPQQRSQVPPRPNSPAAVSPAASRAVQSHDPPLSPSAKLSTGPPISAVRLTRKQTTGTTHTLTTKRSQVFNSSPLGTQTWKPGDSSPTMVKGNVAVGSGFDSSLRTALETPLPPSPIERAWSGSYSASTIPNAGFSKKFQSVVADIAGLQFTPLTESFSAAADTLGFGVETPTKKHYHGRPLPPAPGLGGPGIRPPIDSVYLTESSPSEKGMRRDENTSSNCPEGLLIDLDDNTFVSGMSTPEAARSQTDLRLSPPSASPTTTGFPMLGYGNGHRWHAASASMSTPNLASQPIYPSPLQIVSLTPNPSQGSPVPHVWAPLHAITIEPQWGYDSETDDELPDYEVGSIGRRDTPRSLTHRFRYRSIGPSSQHHLHPKTLRLCHRPHI